MILIDTTWGAKHHTVADVITFYGYFSAHICHVSINVSVFADGFQAQFYILQGEDVENL